MALTLVEDGIQAGQGWGVWTLGRLFTLARVGGGALTKYAGCVKDRNAGGLGGPSSESDLEGFDAKVHWLTCLRAPFANSTRRKGVFRMTEATCRLFRRSFQPK
jgi:hypothetical protein